MLKPLILLRGISPPRANGPPAPPRPAGRPRKPKEKEVAKFSDDELDLHHASKRHNPVKFSTTGDARSEHILLATRKLGKQKIASLLPSAAFPQPPTTGGISSFRTTATLPLIGFGFQQAHPLVTPRIPSPTRPPVTSPNAPTTGGPRKIAPATPSTTRTQPAPGRRNQTAPTAPRTPRAAPKASPDRRAVNPPTTPSQRPTATPGGSLITPSALDHLINASRLVGQQTPTQGGRPGNISVDGSPLKRRRLDDSPGDGAGRMMSALDVLAEQAAVVISQSPRKGKGGQHDETRSDIESEDEIYPAAPPVEPPSPTRTRKGKEKEKEPSREGSQASANSNSRTSSSLKSPIAMRPSPLPEAKRKGAEQQPRRTSRRKRTHDDDDVE